MGWLLAKCWVVLPCLLAASAAAASEEEDLAVARPAITVRVYNYAKVDAPTQRVAYRWADKVFAKARVGVAWMACPLTDSDRSRYPACQKALGPRDLVVRILPRSMAEASPASRDSLGYSLQTDNGFCFLASVLYHRVRELASRTMLPELHGVPLVLGHAIAHEVGHLLLNSGEHSRHGLMRETWGTYHVTRAAGGKLTFTSEQSGKIRANVLARGDAEQDRDAVRSALAKQ